VFLFAVQLLGAATEAAEPLIARTLRRIVVDDGSAIGLSWLTTYGLTNGSVVAALALSLLRSGIVSVIEAFLMIAGSRLGGAAIVVLIGALDYLHKRHGRTLSEGISLGLLTFLITFTIYVPVTVLGLVALTAFQPKLLAVTRGLDLPIRSLQYFDPLTDAVTRALEPANALILALALLLGSLLLFDQVLERVETDTVRTYVFQHFKQRWIAFAIGLLITGVTTSVAFSLGVVVPLYNRQFVRRKEITPYILGANIGTLFDTLVVAFVLETTAGVAIVLQWSVSRRCSRSWRSSATSRTLRSSMPGRTGFSRTADSSSDSASCWSPPHSHSYSCHTSERTCPHNAVGPVHGTHDSPYPRSDRWFADGETGTRARPLDASRCPIYDSVRHRLHRGEL